MNIKARRVGGVLGIEVLEFGLTTPHSNGVWEEVRSSIMANCLLLFRGEPITAPQLVNFAGALGSVMEPQSAKSRENNLPEAPNAEFLSSAPGCARYAGQAWHSDYSYIEKPAALSFFYMRKTPSVGGDTAFANMYAAYDALSERMKGMLDGLEAVHSNAKRHQYQYVPEDASVSESDLAAYRPVKHPLVMVHPVTRRKSLYVSESLTTSIVGLPVHESAALLGFLFEHCARPEFVYRHVWRENDLVVIDNRCTNHCAVADYDMDEVREILIVCVRENSHSQQVSAAHARSAIS
jgi:taurine dioxygenase